MEPLYCGHYWDRPDYKSVLISEVSLYTKDTFGTLKSVLNTLRGVLISECPD